MNSETKVLGIILLASVVLIGGAIFFLSKQSQTPSGIDQKAYDINYSLGEKIGSDSAKIKLTEFSDYQCPACWAAKPTVDDILKAYSQDVQLVYMDFPLPKHLNAAVASTAALVAAGEGKFVAMHDKLFETQEQWSDLDSKAAKEFFADLGNQIGVDPGKITEAIEKNAFADKIAATTAEGNRVGVDSTPTFFINGKKVKLVNSFDELKIIIEKELKAN